MDIQGYYKILGISDKATNEEITASYKKLALLYHPDKNRDKPQWATEAMTGLNIAYSEVMSHRFARSSEGLGDAYGEDRADSAARTPSPGAGLSDELADILTARFVRLRESAKDALYRYFQYTLYRFPVREDVSKKGIFNRTVLILRRTYHGIEVLSRETDDPEFREHFRVFNSMIFNFYRASECIDIFDSSQSQYEVEAYRLYREGDDKLHRGHKEIFFDRHNRGRFLLDKAYSLITGAGKTFGNLLQVFADSTWAVEAGIKFEYARSLQEYLSLFFINTE